MRMNVCSLTKHDYNSSHLAAFVRLFIAKAFYRHCFSSHNHAHSFSWYPLCHFTWRIKQQEVMLYLHTISNLGAAVLNYLKYVTCFLFQQNLMIMEQSDIIEYYPLNFKTDLNGKQQEWEAVVLIPFIDEVCLVVLYIHAKMFCFVASWSFLGRNNYVKTVIRLFFLVSLFFNASCSHSRCYQPLYLTSV